MRKKEVVIEPATDQRSAAAANEKQNGIVSASLAAAVASATYPSGGQHRGQGNNHNHQLGGSGANTSNNCHPPGSGRPETTGQTRAGQTAQNTLSGNNNNSHHQQPPSHQSNHILSQSSPAGHHCLPLANPAQGAGSQRHQQSQQVAANAPRTPAQLSSLSQRQSAFASAQQHSTATGHQQHNHNQQHQQLNSPASGTGVLSPGNSTPTGSKRLPAGGHLGPAGIRVSAL
ncbi:unnamed protein product [Protopolystoma xenopodis]|uniref:Uncharacterized protein n=1 Tax=Protopolystoma xenopodis TaxID=117903 RepID=A0A448WB52_9PLAT|nr:unnamed protein product [Protopolystoma xenopodis]